MDLIRAKSGERSFTRRTELDARSRQRTINSTKKRVE
jgi:hypothetical protein